MLDLDHNGNADPTKLAKTPKQGVPESPMAIKDNNIDNASIGAVSAAKYREQLSQVAAREERTADVFSKRR